MARTTKSQQEKKLRVPTLVRPTKQFIAVLGKKRPKYFKDLPLVFMGEIKNMPEHGVFIGMKSGKIYSGYHVWNFEEIPDDET